VSGRPLYKGNIRELDGLRGIAIFLVLIHHFWPRVGPLVRYHEIPHLGWIGVDLFFVISGFLIGGILLDTLGDAHYYRNFYARRSLRIFPLYYLFLVVMFIAVPMAEHGSYFRTSFLRESGSPLWYFLYQSNLREAILGHEPAYFLAPLWSLSIEEQFYISFALIVQKLGHVRLGRLLWGLILAAPVYRVLMFLLVPGNERIQYLSTPSRVDVISMGVLIALSFRLGRVTLSRRKAGWLAGGMIAVFITAFALGGMDRYTTFTRLAGYSLVAVMFATIVLWAVLNRGRTATSFLRFGPLCYLGKICYGVYLLQRPAEAALMKTLSVLHFRVNPGSFWLMPAKITVAILVASISWYVFEQRILRLKDRFVSARHPSERAGGQETAAAGRSAAPGRAPVSQTAASS